MIILAASIIIYPLATGENGDSASAAEQEAPAPLLLPIALFQAPHNSLFGVEMLSISDKDGLTEVKAANVSYVRRNALKWSEIETTEGVYDWSKQDWLMGEFRRASEAGMQVILVVRSTPTWAQAEKGATCGRIRPEKLPAFAKFMAEAVKKYSVHPYNVKYFEIWNEPDADRSIILGNPDAVFGCWGDKNDSYYGGEYYADVLSYIYPAVKAANPAAKVVVGGLLLGCKEDLAVQNINCDHQEKYIEGILYHHGARDGGNYFDMLNFHSYDYYYGEGVYRNAAWGNNLGNSLTDGPTFLKKLRFLQETLDTYNYGQKEIIVTETALLCGTTGDEPYCQTDAYEKTKAYYLAESFALSVAKGFRINIWYAVKSMWRGSALLEFDLFPLPAYYAYKFAEESLNKSRFTRDLWEYPDTIKGLEFTRKGKIIWMMWSTSLDNNGNVQPISIQLPSEPSRVYTVFGKELTDFSGTSLLVTAAPLYIEWDK
jgi:hypothetical protein